MENIFISPGRYCQGPGLIHKVGEKISKFGDSCMVIGDEFVFSFAKYKIEKSLGKSGVKAVFETFGNECSRDEIKRLKDRASQTSSEIIVAVGGGKTQDTAKAVAYELNCPCVIVPTIASTDAPTSSLAVIYTPNHEHEAVLFLPRNPDLVVVDTEIIAAAPARFLVAGMGDAIATKYEAEACFASGAKNFQGSRCTLTALTLSQFCHSILMDHGIAAKMAADENLLTPSVEKVIEANILLSGLGFENGGEAIAHSFAGGVSLISACHSALHGEKVAVGLMVQLLMEDRPLEEIYELMAFYRAIGLPISLAEIGWENPSDEELGEVAARMCRVGSIAHNMPFEVNETLVVNTLKYLECLDTSAKHTMLS
ncbi:glycerol dehydrogenase [Desulforhopalus sp. 52FAK]